MTTCTLIIKDEVNVKLEGLTVGTRRDLNKKFKYQLPGARYIPAVRLGRWDGCETFFQLGGSSYVNLLPEILPLLDQAGYSIELDDRRTYNRSFEFRAVDENFLADRVWPQGHPLQDQPIVLRDYQLSAVNEFLKNIQSIQCISTGAGKTIITATLAKCVEHYGRSLLIVPSKNLVTQTEEDYVNIGLDVGVIYGDRKQFENQHLICTWQSLNSLVKDHPEHLLDIMQNLVCVMVDEAHSLKADKLKSLMTQIFAEVPIRWAVTGTIPKEEYEWRALQVCVGNVINNITAAELQDRGVLANCDVHIVQLVDYATFRNYQDELKYLLENKERLTYIAGMVNQLEGNTLVLIDRVDPGRELAAQINNATFLSGSTKVRDRREQYTEVNFSNDKVLVATYGIAAVGINIVKLHNLVLIEPGKSFVRVIQSIGRGLRKGFEKDHVNIWDVTSTCKFSKRHLTKRKQFYLDAQYPYQQEKKVWQ
jgi:superfamily II DNA or RNA helicase